MLPANAYSWITRFGEIGILWPVAVALTLWMLVIGRSWRLALAWLLPLAAAVLITSLSKIAFLGWGVGIRAIDFTGFSGHAMFSAAIYPVMAFALTASSRPERRAGPVVAVAAVAAAYLFAMLIAYSRIEVHAHSWSEVIAGFALGAAASGYTLALAGRPPGRAVVRWVMLAVAGWLVLMPGHAAPSRTHGIVTELSIRLAGRDQPFSRADLHRQAQLPQAVPSARPASHPR